MKTKAVAITKLDWNDIAFLPAVQKAFESKHMWGNDLAEVVYGAKFILENEEREVVLFTLVRTFANKEVTVVLERHDGEYTVIKNGTAKVQKSVTK